MRAVEFLRHQRKRRHPMAVAPAMVVPLQAIERSHPKNSNGTKRGRFAWIGLEPIAASQAN